MIDLKGKDIDSDSMEAASDRPAYPWGTELRFGNELIKELGLDGLTIGDKVQIVAVGTVESVHQEQMAGGDSEKRICIQLVEMEAQRRAESDAEKAAKLYS